MGKENSRVILIAALLSLIGLLSAGVASASSLDEGWDEPARVTKVSWFLVSIDGPRPLPMAVSTGFCVGTKKPRLLRPHVAWRQRRAVITARLFQPALHFGPHEAC